MKTPQLLLLGWQINPLGHHKGFYYPTDAFPGWSQRLQKGLLYSVVPTEYALLYFTPLPKHVEGRSTEVPLKARG